MSLSPAQNAVYRPLLQDAYDRSRSPMPFDSWYRDQLRKSELSIDSTTEIPFIQRNGKRFGDPDQFRILMLHFARIAGDEKWLGRLATEHERRMQHHIRNRLDQIARLDPQARASWDYARAVCHQMKLPLDIADCPVEWLWKVFQALDTHLRRLRRNGGRQRRRITPQERSARQQLKTRPAHMVEA